MYASISYQKKTGELTFSWYALHSTWRTNGTHTLRLAWWLWLAWLATGHADGQATAGAKWLK
jgi:hypothetical protein